MSEQPRNPSIYDVAERAGVSHQTVSRVLNGFAGVRPETRDRVQSAIDELGFLRNSSARTLTTRRSHSIGVLAPAGADFGPTSTLSAIEASAREAGLHALTLRTSPAADDVREALTLLLSQSVEGIAVIAPHRGVSEALRDLRIPVPVVTLQAGVSGVGSRAAVDQERGIGLVLEHLRALGHRRVQFAAGPVDYIDGDIRRAAFHSEVERLGMSAEPDLQGDWTAASGFAAARSRSSAATALVCANDEMAAGALHALLAEGVDVPGELSVVGFDDIPLSAHTWPPLTTVHQDFEAVGRRAVEVLLGRVAAGGAAAELIEPALVVRGSTGHARP